MSRRRKLWIWGLSVGIPLTVALLSWFWWLPAAARARAVEAAERRGVDADIGGASIRLSGVVLEEVALTGRHGGLSVRASELGVHASLFGLLLSGASAIDEVQARGVSVEIDLAHGGAESLGEMRRALQGDGGEQPEAAGAGGRTLGALDVQVLVDDAVGPLVRVTDGTLRRGPERTELGAAALSLGGDPGHEITVRGATAILARDPDRGSQLLRASVEEGSIVWARSTEPEEPDGTDDGVDSEILEEDDAPGPDEAEAADSADGEDGVVGGDPDAAGGEDGAAGGDPDAADPPRLLARLRRLVEAVTGPSDEEPASSGADDQPGWVRRLAPDARIALQGMKVETRTEEGTDTILRELEAELVHRGGGSLHFDGSGSPPTSGSLAWDLELHPLDLRAEGTVSLDDLPLALVTPLVPQVPWLDPQLSRIDGDLTVSGDATEPLSVEGRLTVRDAALFSPRIAPDPVTGITFTLEGRGTWDNQARRLEIAEATLQLGQASARIAGALEWAPDHYLVDLTATLPSTNCGTAIGAIPRDLLADLSGFSWQGRLGARVVAHIDSRALDETTLDIDVADGCRFETVPAAADLRRVQGPFTHSVLEPDGTWFEMTTGPGTANWTSIHSISPYLIQAVLAHEDASFFSHHGFAPWAIRDALERNLEEGRYVVGASTITMQLAKNLFLHREKTLARKVQEVLLTWWLESALDKTSILELYLNVIEYGPAIYGIRNAAWHYFGREPEELSPAESAFLACILPNPKLYHHQYERDELSNSMKNRMERLLRHMHARGRIDEEALDYGLSEIPAFAFHHEGDPMPAPREIPGSAGELPFATGAVPPAAALWETWELPPDAVPEGGDPVVAPEDVPEDAPGP